MNVEVFFDTDVLVYAAVRRGEGEHKRKRALELIKSENFGTSAQVLQEFFITVGPNRHRGIAALPYLPLGRDDSGRRRSAWRSHRLLRRSE